MARLELSVRNTAGVVANLQRFPERAKRAAQPVVRAHGEQVQALTQLFAPVDTGFTQDHVVLVVSPEGLVYEVGFSATDYINAGLDFYVFWVIEGAQGRPGNDFLGAAYNEDRPDFIRDLRAALGHAARAA